MNKKTAWLGLVCLIIVSLFAYTGYFFYYKQLRFPRLPLLRFSLENYDQNLDHWISPTTANYDLPLLSTKQQQQFVKDYYDHYYGTTHTSRSPWNPRYIHNNPYLQKLIAAATNERELIKKYSNARRPKASPPRGYGSNYQAYSEHWIQGIIANIASHQYGDSIHYAPKHRAIAIKNLYARGLPTADPYFADIQLAGSGYPFDLLQESAVWAGTPIYILGMTQDRQWVLVLTPHFAAWVPSSGVARVTSTFVKQWRQAAQQGLVAITKTNLSILDPHGHFRLNSYLGTTFPGRQVTDQQLDILIPSMNEQHVATIVPAHLSTEDATLMPLPATPRHFVKIMKQLLGRPYGWGNLYFYNDCSAELQSLYTPFGLWLPRNSSGQAQASTHTEDLSPLSIQARLNHLTANAQKFTTLIYIGGHIMTYLGSYPDPLHPQQRVPLTFQNIWGLRPADGSYRAVIGKSVLLPLLARYPEDAKLASPASKKQFKLSYLF